MYCTVVTWTMRNGTAVIGAITTVDSSENVNSYEVSTIAWLWPDGSAHITYFDGRTLKYAHQIHGKWIIEKVDIVSPGYDYYGGSTTLLMDSHDNPAHHLW